MKNWKRPAVLTTLAIFALLYVIFKAFNFRISISSSAIEFSPGQTESKIGNEVYEKKPKNIIVFIADGMGFSHMSLAMLSQQQEEETSIWQDFEVKGWHDARCTYGPLTDSGASGTAMATGTPTYWDVIGQDPDGNNVPNVFEKAKEQGYATGIVTDSYIWDATPAAFYAHTKSRDNAEDILVQAASSELDLLFGELEDLGEDEVPDYATTMDILEERFLPLDKSLSLPQDKNQPLMAIYDEDHVQNLKSSPNLTQLTQTALNRLTSLDKPFVLLVESEEMDAASHSNNSKRIIRGMKSLQSALSLVVDFADQHGETLVLFTSDHETGGLAAIGDYDNYPNMQIRWTTKEHTASVVPILAKGPGAEHFAKVDRNWEIGVILKNLIRQDTTTND